MSSLTIILQKANLSSLRMTVKNIELAFYLGRVQRHRIKPECLADAKNAVVKRDSGSLPNWVLYLPDIILAIIS